MPRFVLVIRRVFVFCFFVDHITGMWEGGCVGCVGWVEGWCSCGNGRGSTEAVSDRRRVRGLREGGRRGEKRERERQGAT